MSSVLVTKKYTNLVRVHLSPFLKEMGFKISGFDFKRDGKKCKQIFGTSLRKVRGEEHAYISVYPGFIYDEIQDLAAEIQGEQRKKGRLTSSGNIGLLTPMNNYLEWKVDPTTDEEALAREIHELVKEYAVPYWDEFIRLESLTEAYEQHDPRVWNANNKWKLYACYCLVGKTDVVIAEVQEQLKHARASRRILETALENLLKIKQRQETKSDL